MKKTFQEFVGETRKSRLSEVACLVNGRAEAANLPYVGTENLIKNFGGVVVSPSEGQIGTAFRTGDILLGNIRPYLRKLWLATFDGVASPDVLVIRPTAIDSCLLSLLLTSDAFFSHIEQGYKGSKMPRGDKKQIMSYEFMIPYSLEKQLRVSSAFSLLNEKIALTERKLKATEDLKSSLKNKIFNQKISLKDSKSKAFPTWKNFNFFDLVESITDFRGRTPKKLGMEWSESPTNYVTLSALNVKSWGIDYSSNFHYGDEDLYKKWMTKSELHKGQVIMTTEAPAGVVMQIPDQGKYILGQRVIALNLKTNLVSESFFAQLLRSDKVQNEIRKLSSGGTAIGISQKSLKALNLMLPISLEEQEKISNLFSLLDEKIKTSKRKIDRLHALKRGLMQKMFI